MKNPLQTIREARREADSLLSIHETTFAMLVANDANEFDFNQRMGLGLFAAYELPLWERPRFCRKLRQLHAKALERLEVRRAVMSEGMKEIALAAWPKEIGIK